MGANSSSHSREMRDPTENAELFDESGVCQFYRDTKTGSQYEKYRIQNDGSQDFENKYEFRIKNHSEYLVDAYYAKASQNAFGCTSADKYEVVTERIPQRLADIHVLPSAKTFNFAKSSLKGFNQIYRSMGLILVKDTMIGVNKKGKVKVWLNENFALNSPEQQPLSYTMLPDLERESTMVDNVIDLVNSRAERWEPWTNFVNQKYSKGRIGFEEALSMIASYEGKYSIGNQEHHMAENQINSALVGSNLGMTETHHEANREEAIDHRYPPVLQSMPPVMAGIPAPEVHHSHSNVQQPVKGSISRIKSNIISSSYPQQSPHFQYQHVPPPTQPQFHPQPLLQPQTQIQPQIQFQPQPQYIPPRPQSHYTQPPSLQYPPAPPSHNIQQPQAPIPVQNINQRPFTQLPPASTVNQNITTNSFSREERINEQRRNQSRSPAPRNFVHFQAATANNSNSRSVSEGKPVPLRSIPDNGQQFQQKRVNVTFQTGNSVSSEIPKVSPANPPAQYIPQQQPQFIQNLSFGPPPPSQVSQSQPIHHNNSTHQSNKVAFANENIRVPPSVEPPYSPPLTQILSSQNEAKIILSQTYEDNKAQFVQNQVNPHPNIMKNNSIESDKDDPLAQNDEWIRREFQAHHEDQEEEKEKSINNSYSEVWDSTTRPQNKKKESAHSSASKGQSQPFISQGQSQRLNQKINVQRQDSDNFITNANLISEIQRSKLNSQKANSQTQSERIKPPKQEPSFNKMISLDSMQYEDSREQPSPRGHNTQTQAITLQKRSSSGYNKSELQKQESSSRQQQIQTEQAQQFTFKKSITNKLERESSQQRAGAEALNQSKATSLNKSSVLDGKISYKDLRDLLKSTRRK